MRVSVLAFARVGELLGGNAHSIELPEHSLARDVWETLCERCDRLRPLADSTRVARNGHVVGYDEPLADGDEVAFLPPVGGG